MDANIFKTLSYFQFFQYAPTITELHRYLEVKTDEDELNNRLDTLVKKKKIRKHYVDSTARYTLGEYSKSSLKLKIHHSKLKIKRIKQYLNIVSRFPHIELVGLSGSVAMMNADKTDDIDLFIISAPGRMWTARFFAVLTARILRRGRKRAERRGEYGDKVCLNLFFDGNNIALPKKKRTLYGAHEVLQMKPLVNKHNTYSRFLNANKWVFKIFPNVNKPNDRDKDQTYEGNIIGDAIEAILKYLQIYLIRKHQTTEFITETQLWFHPEDYSNTMQRFMHSRKWNPSSSAEK